MCSFTLDYYWASCFAPWTSEETPTMYSFISSSAFQLSPSWGIPTNVSRGTDSEWQLDLMSNRIRGFHIRSRWLKEPWWIGLSSQYVCRSTVSSWRWSIWNGYPNWDQSTLHGLIEASPEWARSISNRTSSFEDGCIVSNGLENDTEIVYRERSRSDRCSSKWIDKQVMERC